MSTNVGSMYCRCAPGEAFYGSKNHLAGEPCLAPPPVSNSLRLTPGQARHLWKFRKHPVRSCITGRGSGSVPCARSAKLSDWLDQRPNTGQWITYPTTQEPK